jgi:hypothetical protein
MKTPLLNLAPGLAAAASTLGVVPIREIDASSTDTRDNAAAAESAPPVQRDCKPS